MNQRLSHLLLAFLLFCAQIFAAAHAVEHALEGGKGLPQHACELCLVSHDLGAGLSGKIAALPPVAAVFIPHDYVCVDRGALPTPQPRQQSPPFA